MSSTGSTGSVSSTASTGSVSGPWKVSGLTDS